MEVEVSTSQNKVSIKKDECELKISHKTLLKKIWVVDICRSPIHIKQRDLQNVRC